MENESNKKKFSDKKSLWYFFFMISSFVLLNTFFFDNTPKQTSEEVSSYETVEISDLPITYLKNSLGHIICSTVTVGDTLVTLSTDNLPKTLLNNSDNIHLVQKSNDGILLYSDKITPNVEVCSEIKSNQTVLIVSNLSSESPALHSGSFNQDSISFFKDAPENNGLALVETRNGLALAGLYDSGSKSLKQVSQITDLSSFIASIDSSYIREKEEFYCLENEFMQVVFSSRGGAIAELNLKLHDEKDPNSVVLPIEFDKEISKMSPENSLFPINPCFTIDAQGQKVAMKPATSGFTPLLRRTLIKNGKVIAKIPSNKYALALTNGSGKNAGSLSVTKFTKDSIQFKGKLYGKDVQRTYKLVNSAPYTMEMKTTVNGNIENLMISSGVPESEGTASGNTPAFLYYYSNGSKMKLTSFSTPKDSKSNMEVTPRWTANTNGFFSTILYPGKNAASGVTVKKIDGDSCPSRLSLLPVDKPFDAKNSLPGYEILVPFKGSISSSPFYFYSGPLDKTTLAKVDTAFMNTLLKPNPEFVKATTVRGWLSFISDPFAKFMNAILNFFYFLTSSWGLSIILLTITLRLILYPFNAKAYKSMLKLKSIAPKQKALEAKHKSDPQRLRMELSMLFKNEGVNPLASILPIFLQIPFFIGMFDLLKTKFALRGATFIPGWIDNLTAPDVIFSWHVNIPFIGNQFHLLPLIGAITMHLSQKFSNAAQEKKKNPTDMEKQMKAMGPILTVVFFFIFYNLASGLNIYLILSSVLGVLQQWYVNHRYSKTGSKMNVLKN